MSINMWHFYKLFTYLLLMYAIFDLSDNMSQVWLKNKEHDNFLRIMLVLNGTGTQCVRIVFDREFHPDTLITTLNRSKYPLRNKINPTMRETLYPPPGKI